jgi:Protein of unknown function (DUF3551)
VLRKAETLEMQGDVMMRRILLTAAAAAALCFSASSSQAQYSGVARWCAVISIGTGSVHWDCQYNTVEACVPNVLAGNRGFCQLNPYYGHPSNYESGAWQEPPAPHYRHYSRRQPHKHSPKS